MGKRIKINGNAPTRWVGYGNMNLDVRMYLEIQRTRKANNLPIILASAPIISKPPESEELHKKGRANKKQNHN